MFLGKGKCRNVQYSVGAAAMATGILITLLFNFNSLLNLTFALCKECVCLTAFGNKLSPVVLIPQSHIHWKTLLAVLAKSVRWLITLSCILPYFSYHASSFFYFTSTINSITNSSIASRAWHSKPRLSRAIFSTLHSQLSMFTIHSSLTG